MEFIKIIIIAIELVAFIVNIITIEAIKNTIIIN